MFNLDGIYSMIVFLICAVLTVAAAILKLFGLLLVGWPVVGALAVLAVVFLLLCGRGIW